MYSKNLIIILGSPNDDQGNLSSIAKERCCKALEVISKLQSFNILLTGGFGEHFNRTNKPHAFYLKQYLILKGVKENIFTKFAESSNTVEDVTKSYPIIQKINPDKIFIVTSDFHKNRAEYLFKGSIKEFEIAFYCSKTNIPEKELFPIKEHERKALNKLKTGIYQ